MWSACCRGSELVAIDTGFMGLNYSNSISAAGTTAKYAFVATANHTH